MGVAVMAAVRSLAGVVSVFAVLAILATAVAGAPAIARADAPTTEDEPPLISAEVRAGYGIAVGGGAGRASLRGSPLVLAAGVAIAVRDEPRMSGYGGLIVETLDRTGIGGEAGVTLEPRARLRLRAGGIA